MNSRFFDYCCLVLVLIGAINWGLVGFFKFDLVKAIFWQHDSCIKNYICNYRISRTLPYQLIWQNQRIWRRLIISLKNGHFIVTVLIYASSEKNRMLACRFGEHRDNSRNSQSVFLELSYSLSA